MFIGFKFCPSILMRYTLVLRVPIRCSRSSRELKGVLLPAPSSSMLRYRRLVRARSTGSSRELKYNCWMLMPIFMSKTPEVNPQREVHQKKFQLRRVRFVQWRQHGLAQTVKRKNVYSNISAQKSLIGTLTALSLSTPLTCTQSWPPAVCSAWLAADRPLLLAGQVHYSPPPSSNRNRFHRYTAVPAAQQGSPMGSFIQRKSGISSVLH